MTDLTKLERALTPQERRLLFKTTARKNTGHAAAPGTGPFGQTCGTCEHLARTASGSGRVFRKCGLMESTWTHGPGTDIRARDLACSKWEKEK